MSTVSKKSSYLQDGRLGEVLALIQVLAYDRNTSRSESGLQDELKVKPDSASDWVTLAKYHPEFFRVRDEGDEVSRVALVARYVLPHTVENKRKIRPQLDPATVNKLMELAVELHDRQVSRSERWKILIPMVVAVVGASASITAAIVKYGV